MPNKHGLGYKRLIRMENGPALFGAWCSMCQVVSRQVCDRNGYLTDTGLPDGKPLTATDISLLTDIDPTLIQKMLDVCASAEIGWINDDLSVSCQDTIGANQDIDKNLKSDMTGKGEGKGSVLSSPDIRKEFEETWELYPDKSGKEKAWQAYQKWMKEGDTQAMVLSGINRYIAYVKAQRESRFPDLKFQNGKTWYNQRGWTSEWKLEQTAIPEPRRLRTTLS